MSELLTETSLRQCVDRWIADGLHVAGPRRVEKDRPVADCGAGVPPAQCSRDGLTTKSPSTAKTLIQYARLASADQLTLDGFIRPANSIKEFVFPRHEKLYGYRFAGKQIELIPLEPPIQEQIIIGARPCDAAALPALDRVFNWDMRDELYNHRRELTTIVTVACREHDAHCFCTSVGLGPGDTCGSDVLLIAVDGERYEVRCVTDKGRRLFAGQTIESSERGQVIQGPPAQFDLADVGEFLAGGYEAPAWQNAAMRCLGCGACAYTCPTCHCFDIVDERNGAGGTRVRNWDACQFAMFTAHASGHNPRGTQAQRQRQRLYHKFQIYPEKFGELLCTGCGNCTRNCPVGLGVLPVLQTIAPKP